MDEIINLTLVTPERRLISAQVKQLTARALQGQVEILPGHANYITILDAGELAYEEEGKKRLVAVSGGFAEVTLDQGIKIMAEAAEFAEDIDAERARAAKERAEKRIQAHISTQEEIDLARAETALKRSLIRLQVAGKMQ